MADKKKLFVSKENYETCYRILITSQVESVAEQRNLNDVLTVFEKAGQVVGEEVSGLPRMYSITEPTTMHLNAVQARTLKQHVDKGINRFQTWAVRGLPDLMDAL